MTIKYTPATAKVEQRFAPISCMKETRGFTMQIQSPGRYSARCFATAEVFAIRGKYCIGYVTYNNQVKNAAVWLAEDGTRVDGLKDEDLIKFVGPAKPRIRRIQQINHRDQASAQSA
jgi:hypothetical protein